MIEREGRQCEQPASVGNEITCVREHVSTNISFDVVTSNDDLHNSFLYKLVFRQPPVIILCSMVIY